MPMNPNKGLHIALAKLLDDINDVEEWFKSPYAQTMDGKDIWLGLSNLVEVEYGKDSHIRPFLPRLNFTREAIITEIRKVIPQIRENVLRTLNREYNEKLDQLGRNKQDV